MATDNTSKLGNTNSCCTGSYPAFPATVTVNQSIIEVDDGELQWITENITATKVGLKFTLSYQPLDYGSLEVFKNGLFQPPACYTVSGRCLIWNTNLDVDDNIVVKYVYTTTSQNNSGINRIGIIEAWSGDDAAIPAGSILLQLGPAVQTIGGAGSGADLLGEQYRDLYNIIGSKYNAVPGTPASPVFETDAVRLPNVEDVFHNGTTLVQYAAIIWYRNP